VVVAVYPLGYHEARQRTSSDLKLNPHVRAAFLDGAYRDKSHELDFRAVGHLSTREVAKVLERTRAAKNATPLARARLRPHAAARNGSPSAGGAARRRVTFEPSSKDVAIGPARGGEGVRRATGRRGSVTLVPCYPIDSRACLD